MELDFVQWLCDRLPASEHLRLGVGDDAAVVALRRPELVTTADLLVDGVHFLTAEHAPERIGRKALAVNLSDLAAMAARPVGALVSLALPREGAGDLPPRELAARLIEGMLPLAEEFGCPIVGGDTNLTPGPLVVAVTALGEPTERGVVRRDGARPGDWLMVTGEGLGGSLAGKHLDFTPRIAEALSLHAEAELHAMMDLSDGLAMDLRRMCATSGVGAVVVVDWVPIAQAAGGSLDRALSDGEDFELLIAMPEAEACRLKETWVGKSLHHVGMFTQEPDLLIRQPDGSHVPLVVAGYEHR